MPKGSGITANTTDPLQSEDRVIIVREAANTELANTITMSVEDMLSSLPSNTHLTNLFIANNSVTPANSTATTVESGQVFFDANYLYIAIANNEVKRVSLNTF